MRQHNVTIHAWDEHLAPHDDADLRRRIVHAHTRTHTDAVSHHAGYVTTTVQNGVTIKRKKQQMMRANTGVATPCLRMP